LKNSNFLMIRQYFLHLLIGAILLLFFLQIIDSVTAKPGISPTVTPPIEKTHVTTEIEELESALQSDRISPEDRSMYEAKLVAARIEATQRAMPTLDSKMLFIYKQTAIVLNTPRPITTGQARPVGLIIDPPPGEITNEAVFSSIWVQPSQDTFIQVCAGHLAMDNSQGVIFLLIENPRALKKFLAPIKTGMLTIVRKDGDILLISSQSGLTLHFDLQKLTMLEAVDPAVGTATPVPANAYP
jgi:hypothetical protein